MRVLRLATLALVVGLAGLWAWAWIARLPGQSLGESFVARLGLLGTEQPVPGAGGGLALPSGIALGGPFSLIDEQGQPVTEASFGGRWLLIYFGYTHCPDVCPTELGTVATTLDLLGPTAERVVPMLISIDPERDTPTHLADYVSRFHPRLRGLTGSPAQVAEVARRYRVYYARSRSTTMTDYLVDHSGFLYLSGPDGKVRALFRPQTAPEELAASIGKHLQAG